MFIVVREDIVMQASINDKIFKVLSFCCQLTAGMFLCTLDMTEFTFVMYSYIIVHAFVNT
jgi:hypothetical protein